MTSTRIKGSGGAAPSQLGKLRLTMLKWYCSSDGGHSHERPCINYSFMQKLRGAKDPEARKAIIAERTKGMPPSAEGRKKLAEESKSGYMAMYKAYCAQP